MDFEALIGIDPGTEKCGIALVDGEGRCIWRGVVASDRFPAEVERLARHYGRCRVVIGDGTGAGEFVERFVKSGLTDKLGPPVLVDERYSTEEARRLYLLEHRRGWRRFVPLGLQTPDQPVDDYVAEVLARRYLKQWRGSASE